MLTFTTKDNFYSIRRYIRKGKAPGTDIKNYSHSTKNVTLSATSDKFLVTTTPSADSVVVWNIKSLSSNSHNNLTYWIGFNTVINLDVTNNDLFIMVRLINHCLHTY
jgi:hypothetical protein